MQVLEVEGLTKRFGDVLAVDDLSFAVQPGEIYGFLGGNGAGKTTTLRMVLDIIRPSAGRISVLGSAPGRRNTAAIGFLPEERGLYGNMSAIDVIAYFGQLKQMPPSEARAHGMELLARFDLADRARAKICEMSKGMAQKVQLATALVNRPKLLILDEPFSGLDPVNQGLLEQEILRASAGGAAVVFSTHVMQHAERLCQRLLLLRRGRKRFEGTIEEARSQLPSTIDAVAPAGIAAIPGVARATERRPVEGGLSEWTLDLEPGTAPGDVLEQASVRGLPLRRFEERRATLHDVFVHLVGSGDGRESAQ
ncbi:ABC transporter ATP-binding protein [Qipengyuania sediminis]|uniref:ABC transporter ATP-binding protein n=1 Tax=Qipengyuania sediminis TaxID=1532023 RepID=UPI00105947D0|nr:ATP-binding cassette domain-containing protein [Qipengyuania sediminis]